MTSSLIFAQGIVTEAARRISFPVPLCSAAEQMYLMGLLNGLGSEDDAGMVRMYFPSFAAPKNSNINLSSNEKDVQEKLQLVLDFLEIVHLVAAAEATAFAHRLDLDLKQFVILVNDAAGATTAFRNISPHLLIALGTPDVMVASEAADVSVGVCINRLNKVVSKARSEFCPLHLANAALGVLTVVKHMAGSNAGVSSTVKFYTGNLGK